MNKQTHIAFGLVTGLLVMNRYTALTMKDVVYGSLAAAVAAPLPDVDLLDNRADNTAEELKSTVKNCLPMIGMIAANFYRLQTIPTEEDIKTLALRMFFWFIYLHFTVVAPHRDWSHSLVWCFLGTYLFRLMVPEYYIWFYIGFASHLVIDLLNKVGERIFFPFKTRICFGMCKADGILNKLIMVASAAGYLYMVWLMQEGI